MIVPLEQYLATPLFLFELSRDSMKNLDHAVFPFWWICTPCALAANAWLTKFITYRWTWEPVPRKLVVRTFPLQLSRKAQGSNHSNLQAATLQEASPIVVHRFTGQNSETKTCAWNVILTIPNLCEIVQPRCSHELMDIILNKTTAQWNFVMEFLSHTWWLYKQVPGN